MSEWVSDHAWLRELGIETMRPNGDQAGVPDGVCHYVAHNEKSTLVFLWADEGMNRLDQTTRYAQQWCQASGFFQPGWHPDPEAPNGFIVSLSEALREGLQDSGLVSLLNLEHGELAELEGSTTYVWLTEAMNAMMAEADCRRSAWQQWSEKIGGNRSS